MGNSIYMVKRHYLEAKTFEEGLRWFRTAWPLPERGAREEPIPPLGRRARVIGSSQRGLPQAEMAFRLCDLFVSKLTLSLAISRQQQPCEIRLSNSVFLSDTHGGEHRTLYPVSDGARREAGPLADLCYRKKAVSMPPASCP